MPVLSEIVSWSRERPGWQQDALRRLAQQPSLSANDIAELVAICKVEHEIEVKGAPAPQSLSAADEAAPAVRLTEVHSIRSVNALRDDQALCIAPSGLTVVYGENGAGKSGYVRVIKQVCRARGGRDPVHPNIYTETASPASAVVCYETMTNAADESVAPATHDVSWVAGATGPEDLAQVSVFDSRSASVYITEQNDVAYLPHGTDLFPKLVSVVEQVKAALERELGVLNQSRDRFDAIPVGTEASDLLGNLHAPGARQRFDRLASLSPAERQQLEELRAEDRRFKAEDPLGRARGLRLCVTRLAAARERLAELEAALDASTLHALGAAREALATARAAAEIVSAGAFTDLPLGGIETAAWRALWDAARRFAETGAVPPQAFPPQDEGSRCVLCQQAVGADARVRMQRFEEFIRGETQAAVDRAARELDERVAAIGRIEPHSVADAALLSEIASLDQELDALLRECMDALRHRRDDAIAAVRASSAPSDWAAVAHSPNGACERLSALAARIAAEAAHYEASVDPEARQAVQKALLELEARAALNSLRERVYAEIDRLTLRAKLRKASASANTAPITRYNTELLKRAVSQPLADEFECQIKALDLTHIPISVATSRGQKGRAYHTVSLDKRTKAKVPTNEVLSEGEHRCVALAAFFAEVSLQDSASTLVFDAPVSSLDHGRRKYVARRLVEIARSRPILIFTHDLVFVWMLQSAAEATQIPLAARHFRRDETGAGIITEDWPWDGQPVKKRIGALKDSLPSLRKLAASNRPEYEREARAFYGKLRETWERSVEEVLFNGALRRFSPEVQTLRLRNIHRVTEQQMKEFEAGMSKASAWIQGHDHAVEFAQPVPEPDELAADLATLEQWVTTLKKQHAT